MTLYLDTSVVVPLFLIDPLNARTTALLKKIRPPIVAISDFSMAEFASVVAARVRAGSLRESEAEIAFSQFDAWAMESAQRVEISPADVSTATSLMRRLDLPLRTSDAIHLALVRRLGATLATFDRQMAKGAKTLGISALTG